ncbi:MAG TPA: cobalt-precorrin-5B (C(1))-methyltransferase [Ktedonobacteraceae bacterium]|nr:cobalt-precorrin-5B (C(1))-methyltransferase [Ktedonobacteraceae bacterium]
MDNMSTRSNTRPSTETEELPGRGKRRGMRTGYTTGACATAATRAALLALYDGQAPDTITITLPVGVKATFAVHSCEHHADGSVTASVLKDAGDDPDVTHGAELRATLSWLATADIRIDGGVGVGRVTKPGLGLEVGSAAINQVPRAMIEGVVRELLTERDEVRGVSVLISVPDGLERSLKTLNARLGVLGGISILGTTGIVKPYSTAAYKASISKAVDVAIACGCQDHLLLTTGSRSEKFGRRYIPLPEEAYIQMGEFTGHALRDSAAKGVRAVTLVGMVGKLSKIGDGRMQTHVAGAAVDLQSMAEVARACGAPEEIVTQVLQANTARHFQELMLEQNIHAVFDMICERARSASQAYVKQKLDIDVLMCDFDGSILGYAGERNVR